MWQGRQYVVAAAGGHGEAGVATGDAIVAFALPAAGEAARSGWDRHIDQPGMRLKLTLAALLAALLPTLWWLLAWRGRRRARKASARA